jgi:N6-adenosine-specific RNA methylase IME4
MTKRYQCILSDCPWNFRTYSDKGLGRSAQAHYACMSLSEICALPVLDYADDNCALFLWVTDPMLPQGLEVMKAWGFAFKSVAFTWAKLNKSFTKRFDQHNLSKSDFFMGTGYYTRANPEMCLLGTRGRITRLSKKVRQLVIAPRREHSRKPDEIYDRIEALVPGPYAEFFSRSSRAGWDCPIGNQAGLFDNGFVETRQIPS